MIEPSTSSLESMLSALARDPLLPAREASRLGQRVVGYIGADIPVELILATHAVPIRLRGAPLAPTPLADTYLESSFMPESRAIAEQWLSGALDELSAVVFPRSDDSAQRLYYYLCELRRSGKCRGPEPLLFDVSTISRASSAQHTVAAVMRLAEELHADLALLPTALARTQQRRALKHRIETLRLSPTTPLGSEFYTLLRYMDCEWSEAFDQRIAEWLRQSVTAPCARRVLFAGNAPPDARIHKAIEASNATIIGEYIDHAHPYEMDLSRDLVSEIAQRHHTGRTLAQQMLADPRMLVHLVEHTHADAVVLWAIEEDEALPWEIARQATALQAAHIPVLTLTRQDGYADSATLDSLSHFVLTLEVRK